MHREVVKIKMGESQPHEFTKSTSGVEDNNKIALSKLPKVEARLNTTMQPQL